MEVREYDSNEVIRYFNYTYDDMDRVETYTETLCDVETYIDTTIYTETNSYDAYGNLSKQTQVFLGETTEYTYVYDQTAQRRLEEISVSDLTIRLKHDIVKRNKGKEVVIDENKLCEESIVYRKVGDHATNIPASIYYGAQQINGYAVNEHLKYAYDSMGNIQTVYENGELAVRYQYDALGRLVREDNKALNSTWVFVYDNNGNILKKREFAFTLKENTLIEELDSTDKVYSYTGDQMLSYNGEVCEYDAIGNPTLYRGKTANWKNDRCLISYDGNTLLPTAGTVWVRKRIAVLLIDRKECCWNLRRWCAENGTMK